MRSRSGSSPADACAASGSGGRARSVSSGRIDRMLHRGRSGIRGAVRRPTLDSGPSMKSIPLLLYLVAAGLFGFAAWTVYQMAPLWKEQARIAQTSNGQKDGLKGLTLGKGGAERVSQWDYSQRTVDWWAAFKDANLIGKLPPPPPEQVEAVAKPVDVAKPIKPLEEIIEIISIAYDGSRKGEGGYSHVIVRYKPEANVQPPEWWVRENTPPTAGAPAAGPRDVAAAPGRTPTRPAVPQPVRPPAGRPPAATPSPMPTSMVGREIVQQLWVEWPDARSPADAAQHTNRLWAPYEDIRLVATSADAQAAFFERDVPPPPAGETPPAAKREELLKTAMNLSQDVLRELRRLQEREGIAPTRQREPSAAAPKQGTWLDVEETTRVNGVTHIGRKEAQRFEQSGDRFFEQLNVDTYVSKTGNLRGLIVRNVDPRLAQQFGVQAGEVLLEVNGRPVQTQAQAIQLGKADYKRGVRTFVTKWLTNGQVVERTYQAPDR
ncbi:MAG: hypothetical protein JNL08_20180 [Planctomycetes bacterium]|nr:hypothetical protein [Planctomycetota bacterium]